jgi:preprotein translocase subunit SecA
MDHIDAMDQLKGGIGLRALGQQDPAAAYASEGFDMFELMIQSIKEETVKFCYNVTVQTTTERKQIIGGGVGRKDDFSGGGEASENGELGAPGAAAPQRTAVPPREKKQETYKREGAKVGRNDPCPCGRGKKYKNCCLNKE